MCGVVAVLGNHPIEEPLRRLMHRGIRVQATHSPAGNMGHVRLPIVGVSPINDQPMTAPGWLIGFVGEILDFRERHPDMECDADLVRDTWVNHGPRGFTNFDGFWGIVAIDQDENTLHILTDYLGQKPMYYRDDVKSAASEIDALIPFAEVTIDHTYLAAVIKWGYCPDVTRTPYNEIKHVPPGCHVVLSRQTDAVITHTDRLAPRKALGTIQADLLDEMDKTVKRRVLSSDVPVACLVSGGLDSAIVWRLASRYGKPVAYRAYSEKEIGNLDDEFLNAIKLVGGEQNLNQICYGRVTITEGLRIMQEPIDLGSLRPQIALAGSIEERVCLTGDGADELFGGYGRSMRYDSQYSDVFHELPCWHLPRLDRAMMSNRVEVRSPFLARRVVELALSLPHEMRQDKNFLRSTFSDLLPPSITHMKKKPLRTPEIASDRENYSKVLVARFLEEKRWLR